MPVSSRCRATSGDERHLGDNMRTRLLSILLCTLALVTVGRTARADEPGDAQPMHEEAPDSDDSDSVGSAEAATEDPAAEKEFDADFAGSPATIDTDEVDK